RATGATVMGSIPSSRALTVDLESTNPAAALVPARVVIPVNQASVQFPVAAVNDDLLNGAKTTFIRPFVLASGTNERLAEGTGALLTVTDDDGPARKVVAEKRLVGGSPNPATTRTIACNTPS